jgi:oligoendopeptidase F
MHNNVNLEFDIHDIVNKDVALKHARLTSIENLLFFIDHPDPEVRSTAWWRLTKQSGEKR